MQGRVLGAGVVVAIGTILVVSHFVGELSPPAYDLITAALGVLSVLSAGAILAVGEGGLLDARRRRRAHPSQQ